VGTLTLIPVLLSSTAMVDVGDWECVPENFILGYMWTNLAAAQGDGMAANDRNSLKGRITPEQIAEAERLTQEWLEEHQ